ncbi:hypothetical protein CLV29_2825 [Naumannella halotolerans]|uniref:Uncharacterized protein n=1 Tax=Naumannella halotolerans TaxID=993414 RepID=A0A4V3EME5_9ACTN|nr:hypothetical protein CLV29_2825 [Naumannella halotolerans]
MTPDALLMRTGPTMITATRQGLGPDVESLRAGFDSVLGGDHGSALSSRAHRAVRRRVLARIAISVVAVLVIAVLVVGVIIAAVSTRMTSPENDNQDEPPRTPPDPHCTRGHRCADAGPCCLAGCTGNAAATPW